MHVILILLVMLANYTFAFAEISEPMTINIIENKRQFLYILTLYIIICQILYQIIQRSRI